MRDSWVGEHQNGEVGGMNDVQSEWSIGESCDVMGA